ncbi:MAG: TraB/GumN family protein [Ruminococcus sp.]|nr:TraB/GumN family protein [Ruminococcus sp.]
MKNRKIFCILLASILTVSAVSCGNTEENSSVSEESSQAEEVTSTEETAEEPTEEVTEEEAETQAETETQAEDSSGGNSLYGSTAVFTDFVKTKGEVSPPLWKVTDPETNNELYIMGTIHVLPSDFAGLPENIKDIYENSDGIAVEYNVNEITSDIRLLAKYQQMFLYEDGSLVSDHISQETYDRAKAYFESLGLYQDVLDQFSAGYWLNQIQSIMILRLENLSSEGVDSQFISLAENDGKEVVNIETLEIQAGAIDGYSDELVDYLISELLDEIDEIDECAENLAELYDLWAVGDVDSMLDSENEEIEELPRDLQDDYIAYNDIMLTDRNQGMAEKASEFLKEGKNYLFMVGSAHYSGDRGVDDLLAEMGYTVEKIS